MRPLWVFALATLVSLSPCQTNDFQRWIKFDYKKQRVDVKSLNTFAKALGGEEYLAVVRAIVFGKHGRVFRDPELNRFLWAQEWYKPNKRFSNSLLNEMERENLDIIRGVEAQMHKTVQPGDLRFWM